MGRRSRANGKHAEIDESGDTLERWVRDEAQGLDDGVEAAPEFDAEAPAPDEATAAEGEPEAPAGEAQNPQFIATVPEDFEDPRPELPAIGDPFWRQFLVPLSVEKRGELAIDMAAADLRVVELESEKAAFMKDWKGRYEYQVQQVHRLGEQVRTGRDRADIVCIEKLDTAGDRVLQIRCDTGDVFDQRGIGDADRAMALPFEGAPQPTEDVPAATTPETECAAPGA